MVLILTFIAGQSSEPSFTNDIISGLGLVIFRKHVGSEQVIRKNIAALVGSEYNSGGSSAVWFGCWT